MDIFPALKPGVLVVVCANDSARNEISHVATELALHGNITVLDGGNRFQAYRISRLIRQRTVDVVSVAKRLSIQRAFTCYQMLSLLESTPSLREPCLVLDLLSTFYDENVPLQEVHRLLEACLKEINRICTLAPVAITLGTPKSEERKFLVEKVCVKADKAFIGNADTPQKAQLSMF